MYVLGDRAVADLVLNLQEGPLVDVVVETLRASSRYPEREGEVSGTAAGDQQR